jgi:hypothetical protein
MGYRFTTRALKTWQIYIWIVHAYFSNLRPLILIRKAGHESRFVLLL